MYIVTAVMFGLVDEFCPHDGEQDFMVEGESDGFWLLRALEDSADCKGYVIYGTAEKEYIKDIGKHFNLREDHFPKYKKSLATIRKLNTFHHRLRIDEKIKIKAKNGNHQN